MVLPLAPIIGGALGLIGGLFQNSAQQASADKQMDFQKEMDSTKYQRGMADMKAAGLNPILAYSQGGAGSPSGAQANVTNVGDAVVKGMQGSVSSAAQAMQMKAQLANIEADTTQKMASAATSVEQAKLASANSAVVLGTMPSVIDKAIADATTAELGATVSDSKASRALIEKQYLDSVIGKTLATAALGGKDAADASSALKNMNPGDWMGKTFKSLGW